VQATGSTRRSTKILHEVGEVFYCHFIKAKLSACHQFSRQFIHIDVKADLVRLDRLDLIEAGKPAGVEHT
jgi:hypothetical protein